MRSRLKNRTPPVHTWQMPSKTMMRASGLGCIMTLREVPTLSSATVQQARDSATQFNEGRNRRPGQRNHLVVPPTYALDEIQHLSKSKLYHGIHALVVPAHLHALAQSGCCRIEFPGLAACRNAGDQRPKVRFGLVESPPVAQYRNRPDEIPRLQFPQGIRHIGARDPERI